jgi:acetyltransferase-like isoleucine patch superfamily enzyme
MRHVDVADRLQRAFRGHPLDWLHLLATAASTAKHRFIYRCAGPSTIVGRRARMINPGRIRIGSHCLILDEVYFRAGPDGHITIGDHCAINSYAKLFGHGGITIGDHTQLGPNTLITTTTHDFEQSMETTFEAVTIGAWAWIGAGSVVLPGIRIGDHAVVGAGSIVTKDLPAYSTAVGNPARVIREHRGRKEEA